MCIYLKYLQYYKLIIFVFSAVLRTIHHLWHVSS